MTLLIDPPAWPAHGRLWSHLVSDTSLHELRAFARAQGIPDRAFDHDHYDVPDERHAELVAAGALAVSGGDLARRLGASVLRVPGRERRSASRTALLARWDALWRVGDAKAAPVGTEKGTEKGTEVGDVIGAVGAELVDRWCEPHRTYHSRVHLAAALDALDLLLDDGAAGSGAHAALALWFHDAVHDGEAGRDEERSAALARELLGPLAGRAPWGTRGLDEGDVREVARLVLVTTDHEPAPDDTTGALVSDADLAVLGSDPVRYARYAAQVRAEYGHVPDDAFRAGRSAVLGQLLDLHSGPGLFRTDAGRRRWAAATARNLRAERDRLGPR